MHLRLNHENVLTFILLQNNKTIKNFYLIFLFKSFNASVLGNTKQLEHNALKHAIEQEKIYTTYKSRGRLPFKTYFV